MIILFVGLEVLCKLINSFAQQSNLHLWGTCVSVVSTKITHYLFFRVLC